jgi:hypothetical protein
MTLAEPSITRPRRRTRTHAPKPEPARSGQCYVTGCDSEVHGYGAYCDEHVYAPPGPQPRGRQALCAACHVLFASTDDCTRHRPFDGRCGDAVTRCKDPRDMGLNEAGGIWASQESHDLRERRRQNPPRRGLYPSQTPAQAIPGTERPIGAPDASDSFVARPEGEAA